MYSTVSAEKRFENLNPRDSKVGLTNFSRLSLIGLKIDI